MWPDNETDLDFLNFTGIAATVAEIIDRADGRPISIGVTGAWGSGKSSLIKLVRSSLEERESQKEFVFVEFNAWLYQGYDDARAALMETIATTLEAESEKRKKGGDKVRDLLNRVDWLRAAKLTAGSALAMALGLPPAGLVGEFVKIGSDLKNKKADGESIEKVTTETIGAVEGLYKSGRQQSPPKEISALRKSFQEALDEMGITLVVLIDDLDRCLPETTISTLEAIRLFLFLENAAFVIAADDQMIKDAVKKHFDGIEGPQVTSYFDKLIQVPIRVPTLGTQEVRAYLMLLFVQNSELPQEVKDDIRQKVAEQLKHSWQGKRVDRSFMESIYNDYPPMLRSRFEAAEKLAPIMVSSSNIEGNPRLIKRFLNALAIRMTISDAQGVGVDEAVLAKMLLLERIGDPAMLTQIVAAVSGNDAGKPLFLAEWEEKALKGEELKMEAPWNQPYVGEWLVLPPKLSDHDLRGALYVSREHSPLVTTDDKLSSEALDLLQGLVDHPEMGHLLIDRLSKLMHSETKTIMDSMLNRAGAEQAWGVPPILDACLAVIEADPSQAPRLVSFLIDRPSVQIQPSIVPKLFDLEWAKPCFDKWEKEGNAPVKAAIAKQREK